MRRRVYDSLNVFLACNIFTKDRKKVTLNLDFYEYLPEEFKEMVDIKALRLENSVDAPESK